MMKPRKVTLHLELTSNVPIKDFNKRNIRGIHFEEIYPLDFVCEVDQVQANAVRPATTYGKQGK